MSVDDIAQHAMLHLVKACTLNMSTNPGQHINLIRIILSRAAQKYIDSERLRGGRLTRGRASQSASYEVFQDQSTNTRDWTVEQLISTFEGDEYKILKLHLIQNTSFRDIGTLMKTSQQTAWKKFKRAVKQLAESNPWLS